MENIKRGFREILLIAVIVIVWFSASFARDDDDELAVELPEIVVTATGAEKTEFEVPYMVDVITADEISMGRLSRSLPDALRQTPGVSAQKSGYGQASPYLRGFTGFRTLLLIDGIRMNNSTYRVGPCQYFNLVDPYSVQRLEVVKGPGSVLYGSDAVGGAINMITLSQGAADPAGGRFRLLYRFAEAERSNVYRAEAGTSAGGRLGVHIGATSREFGDYHSGHDVGQNPHTAYDEQSADAKIEWAITSDFIMVVAYQLLQHDDAWRIHPTVHGISWKGTRAGDEQERALDHTRQLGYVQFHSYQSSPIADRATLSLSYHLMEEERHRVKNDYSFDDSGVDVATWGAFIKLAKDFPGGSVLYGAEYYLDDVQSFRKNYNADGSFNSEAIQGPVGDDAGYEIAGAYAQVDFWLGERLEVLLGARYTFSRADVDKAEDPVTGAEIEVGGDWEAWVGNARAVLYLDEQKTANLYVGVGQAFRAPNLSDLSRLDISDYPNEIEIPSPDLEPERFLTYEAGVKVWNESASAQLGYFYTDVEDMIERNPTGRFIGPDSLVIKNNVGNGYLEGVEASARIKLTASFTAFGSFAWVHGRVDAFPGPTPIKKNEYKDRLPPTTGLAGLRWDSADGMYWAEAIGLFADKADRLSSRNRADVERIPPGGTPGYDVYHLRAGADLGNGLRLTAALENVIDRDYRVHGSGQNEPGRNFIVGVEWRGSSNGH